MKINAAEILNGRVQEIEIDYSEDFSDNKDAESMLPAEIQIHKGGIKIKGKLAETGGYISLTAKVSVAYSAPCDRCLDETDFSINFDYNRIISAQSSPEEREREIYTDDKEWDGVTDDLLYVNGGYIDFTEDLAEEIALNLPYQNLCSTECKGLCPVCGRKLGSEHTGCKEKKEIDPRLEILKKLLDKEDEV